MTHKVLLYSIHPALAPKIYHKLKKKYSLISLENKTDMEFFLTNEYPVCIITDIIRIEKCSLWHLGLIREKHPAVPILVILEDGKQYHYHEHCIANFTDKILHLEKLNILVEEIDNLSRQKLFLKSEYEGIIQNCEEAQIRKVIHFIHLNFPHLRNTNEVSSHFKMSAEILRKEFRQCCGITINQYLIRLRLHFASYLAAKYAELKEKEIAVLSGYADPYTLSHQFKYKVGISFSEFREKYTYRDFQKFYEKNL